MHAAVSSRGCIMDQKLTTALTIILVLFSLAFPKIEATYKLEVHFIRFLNPNHMHIVYEEECGYTINGLEIEYVCNNVWNGYCCESTLTSSCTSQCDNYFKFCLRNFEDSNNTNINYCPGGDYGWSNYIVNSDDIYFTDDIGGIPNPMPFYGTTWTGNFSMRVRIFDYDTNDDSDYVDEYSFKIFSLYPSSWTSVFTFLGGRRRITVSTQIQVQFRVTCNENWYGRDCNTECVPEIGRYICDSDGRRSCEFGTVGLSCDTDCDTEPCQNGATCNRLDGGYTCTCAAGYNGQVCEYDIDECLSRPCQSGATCRNLVNDFACSCPPLYTGTLCEIDLDKCRLAPCLNGASCFNDYNEAVGYRCECAQGYYGSTCGSHPCDGTNNICLNGATCIAHGTALGIQCLCTRGFMDDICGTQISCQLTNCSERGICTITNDNINFCDCDTGYVGPVCEYINECDLLDPCVNGATCEDTVTSYFCRCVLGYTGTNCETDINDCAAEPCQNGGTCMDGVNMYTCHCRREWSGANCDSYDYCLSDPCTNGGTCTNDVSSYTCQCLPGYTGVTCDDIDNCASGPCQNGGTCLNGVNGFSCICLAGFEGASCEDTTVTISTQATADNKETVTIYAALGGVVIVTIVIALMVLGLGCLVYRSRLKSANTTARSDTHVTREDTTFQQTSKSGRFQPNPTLPPAPNVTLFHNPTAANRPPGTFTHKFVEPFYETIDKYNEPDPDYLTMNRKYVGGISTELEEFKYNEPDPDYLPMSRKYESGINTELEEEDRYAVNALSK